MKNPIETQFFEEDKEDVGNLTEGAIVYTKVLSYDPSCWFGVIWPPVLVPYLWRDKNRSLVPLKTKSFSKPQEKETPGDP